MYQFKTKDSEIVGYPLCLGNIWKDFTNDNMKKTGLNRSLYNFSVDCNAVEKPDIHNQTQ